MSEHRRGGTGPLRGVRVVEFAGIGPGPFAAMLLSDMGAEVVSIARRGRAGATRATSSTAAARSSSSTSGRRPSRAGARPDRRRDVLIEGFRAGDGAPLALGPTSRSAQPAPRLRRMTAGAEGPRRRPPATTSTTSPSPAQWIRSAPARRAVSPLTCSAIRRRCAVSRGRRARRGDRGAQLGQGPGGGRRDVRRRAACSPCSRHARHGAVDRQRAPTCSTAAAFLPHLRMQGRRLHGDRRAGAAVLCRTAKLAGLSDRYDAQARQREWPKLQEKMAALFKTRTRDEWAKLLEGSDACAAAVSACSMRRSNPHLVARNTFVAGEGGMQRRRRRASRARRLRSRARGVAAVDVAASRAMGGGDLRRLNDLEPLNPNHDRKIRTCSSRISRFSSPAGLGPGAATARAMAAKGAKVAVIDMNKDGAEKVAAGIKGLALVRRRLGRGAGQGGARQGGGRPRPDPRAGENAPASAAR